ncbi:serine protease 27-like isoform X3 [Lissotriton helveticus]
MAVLASLIAVLYTGLLGMASAQECGKPVVSNRIVGGQDAVKGEWPWQASVQVDGRHICGGTLITDSWVVSAAHCYYGHSYAQSSYKVCMGMYQLSSSNPNSVCSEVKSIIYNTLYTATGTPGDILLLELNTKVNYTNFIMPICLPNSTVEFPSGLNCWVTGWGNIASSTPLLYPMTMQEVMVPLIDQPTCDYLYHKGSSVSSMKPIILSDMICAGYVNGGKDSCQTNKLQKNISHLKNKKRQFQQHKDKLWRLWRTSSVCRRWWHLVPSRT